MDRELKRQILARILGGVVAGVVIQGAVQVGVGLWYFGGMSQRLRVLEGMAEDHEKRIVNVERTLSSLPSREDIKELGQKVDRLAENVNVLRGEVNVMRK